MLVIPFALSPNPSPKLGGGELEPEAEAGRGQTGFSEFNQTEIATIEKLDRLEQPAGNDTNVPNRD
jgi:hypothetical protein